ncbi:MAG: zinc ribbon domain-containing protein [Planctomycetota bacterium]|jgi:uncharacterized Zn finger protein (UPF0148 family)
MRFNCPSCGKVLNVKDEYAGKKARCPGCQEALTVPYAPEAAGAAAAAAPAPSASACPSCGGALPEGAVFCVACGYDLRTGKQLQTVTEEAAEEEDEGASAEDPPAEEPAGGDAGGGYSRDERA